MESAISSLYFHIHNGGVGFAYNKLTQLCVFEMSHFGNMISFDFLFTPSEMTLLITMFMQYLDLNETETPSSTKTPARSAVGKAWVQYDVDEFTLACETVQIFLNCSTFYDSVQKAKEQCATFLQQISSYCKDS